MAKLDTMCAELGAAANISRNSGESLSDWANRIKDAFKRGTSVPMSDVYREWKSGSLKPEVAATPSSTTSTTSSTPTRVETRTLEKVVEKHVGGGGSPVQIVVNAAPGEDHEVRLVGRPMEYVQRVVSWAQVYGFGVVSGIILVSWKKIFA